MRRSPAGLLLLISGVLIALAISCWWFQRVAFSSPGNADAAHAVLADADIRAEVATVIASTDAPTLGQSPAQLKEFIEQIARLDAGSALMTGIVGDAHARLIGESDEQVRISGPVRVTIVRDERVADEPPVTLPVQEVGTLSLIDTAAGWTALVSGVLGILALIGGVVMRPERGESTVALAAGFGSLAALLIVLGYLVPLVVLPALSDSTWMNIFARLANHYRTFTFGLAIVSALIAVGLMFATGSVRQRRQSSTPLSVGRYREQQRWSR